VEYFCKHSSSYAIKEGSKNGEKFVIFPKTKAKGLSQKERDLLDYLKDDPGMKQIVLQKILNKQRDFDDEKRSVLQHHLLHQNLKIFKILRTHMSCNKDGKSPHLLAKCKVKRNYCPARVKCPLAKVKGIYFNKVFCFAG